MAATFTGEAATGWKAGGASITVTDQVAVPTNTCGFDTAYVLDGWS